MGWVVTIVEPRRVAGVATRQDAIEFMADEFPNQGQFDDEGSFVYLREGERVLAAAWPNNILR